MKYLTYIIGLACLYLSIGSAFAADADRDAFENSVYGVVEISHFHADPAKLKQLSAETRGNVVLAKTALVNALKAVQDENGKPQEYLSAALNKQYPTKQGFAQSLLDEEVSMIAVLIDDFTVSPDGTQVNFRFSVVLSTEGLLTAMDRSATIQKVGHDWKVSTIK
jgi:hypothetical protein